MALKPINHYSMSNPATVYDEEALTALELAARTAGKVNEAVAAVNELEEAVATVIDDVDKKLTDTLTAIDRRVDETVDATIDEKFNDGTVEAAIVNYTHDLEKRVDALASLPEGSTTGDAELLDIRVVGETEFSTAGNAVRSIDKSAKQSIVDMVDAMKNSGTLTGSTIYTTPSTYAYLTKGGPTGAPNSNYRVSMMIPVEEGQIYRIKAKAVYGNYIYLFVDSIGEYCGGLVSANTASGTTFDSVVVVPPNATRLQISWYGAEDDGIAYRVTGIEFAGSEAGGQALDILVNSAKLDGDALTETETISNNIILADGRVSKVNDSSMTGYHVKRYAVRSGRAYTVTGAANYGNLIYTIKKTDGKFVGGVAGGIDATFKVVTTSVKIPADGVELYVATRENVATAIALEAKTINMKGGRDWSNIRWGLCGDSLTEVNEHATKRYYDYIAEETGINIKSNFAVSGGGYHFPFETLVGASFAFQAGMFIDSDIDVVTLFGGGNGAGNFTLDGNVDSFDISTRRGAINEVLEQLEMVAYSTGAVCAVISPTPWVGNTPKLTNGSMKKLNDCLREQCEYYGIPYLDLFTTMGFFPDEEDWRARYCPDGVHLNDAGHKRIASKIREFLASLL